MRSLIGAVVVLAALGLQPVPAVAAGSGDITLDILANRNVTLTGDAVVNVPDGTTTYDGAIRGEGSLRIAGSGTLILTKDSDFSLPKASQRQTVRILGGNHPYVVVTRPDPPAVVVDKGATLQYGNGGGTGLIGRFPYGTSRCRTPGPSSTKAPEQSTPRFTRPSPSGRTSTNASTAATSTSSPAPAAK
ncbi:hypothetical protein EV646_111237 [Kribbella antiqua]|uniref:Uncharacterized protein n=1 Tax=Kribbella antiqua TaxID=2512217 RepID=A0A4R2IMW1_9ACTN|nr:hypothetical protein [Kribbella antiqua]TCO44045.1 hypothetical protein EV646_111237 [Kribbella antiqua]